MPYPSVENPQVYAGFGWIGNSWRGISCFGGPKGYQIQVEAAGRFCVSADGRCVSRIAAGYRDHSVPAQDETVLEETIFGPALTLALALQDRWCLHGSAVAYRGRVFVLLGESGRGKSTLARWLGGAGGPWQRVADDVLPVRLDAAGVLALPHFPQLKLPPDQQPGAAMPERMPLAGVYVLGEPAAVGTPPRVEPLSRQETTLALVRHTVASRLFAPDLLAKHLRACSDMSALLPGVRLVYPRTYEALPALAELLAADMEEQVAQQTPVVDEPAQDSLP